MNYRYWLFSILVFLLISFYTFTSFYNDEKNNVIKNSYRLQNIHARQTSLSFQEMFEDWKSILNYLAADEDIIKINERGKEELRFLYKNLSSELKSITRVGPDGRISFTVPYEEAIGMDISSQEHIQEIFKNKKTVISDVFLTVQGFYAIGIHVPVFRKNKFDGTIAFVLNFEKIAENFVRDVRIGKSGYVLLLSRNGTELYCPQRKHVGNNIKKRIHDDPDFEAMIKNMLTGKQGTSVFFYDHVSESYRKMHAFYMPIYLDGIHWSMAVIISEDELIAGLSNFRNKLMILIGVIFLGAILLSYYAFKAWGLAKETKERKKIEAKFRAMLSNSNDIFMLVDPSGIILYVSPAIEMLTNFERTDIENSSFKKFIHPDDLDNVMQVWEQALQNEKIGFRVEYRALKKDGNYIWLEAVGRNFLSDENLNAIVVNIRDITQRRIKDEEIRQKNEEITSFIYSVSHDLKSPVITIRSFVDYMKEDLERNDFQRLSDDLIYIEKASEKMSYLIEDLIELSRLGRVSYKTEELLLQDVINESLDILAGLIKDKNIAIEVTEKPVVIFGDRENLIEVFQNLLENAIKFTSDCERPHIEVGIKESEEIIIYIKDNGIGIEPEYQNKLFGLFEKLHNNYEGTGLGLTIVKKIIEIHGGKIWIESDGLNKGTTVFITLPKTKIRG
ncbi:sensor histidine kinase [Melioribacter sp. OK-6-Me]|uniref:sensor histidine kinase n=1 Tax=unclassified Melioribacter TaxID=2627329 RepID=UPI003ED85A54